jgi:O-antigen/teichoic acid export membrane protein
MPIKLSKFTQKLSPDVLKVASNFGWLLSDKILQMGLALFVGIWVARYLGPSQFGIYSYAISFVGMFTPLVNMGLPSLVVRDIASDIQQKEVTLGTTFILNLIGGLVTLILSVGIIYLLEPSNNLIHILVGIIAVGSIFQAFDVISLWFESQVQSKNIILAKRTAYILVCAVRIWLIQIKAPLVAFACTILLELALSAIGMVITYQKKGNNLKLWKISWLRAKELLWEGFPLVLSGIAIYLYSKIDQVMLGSFLVDKSQLGFYSVAVKLAEIFDFLPLIMASSILPKLSQLKPISRELYQKNLQIYFDIMLLMWLVIVIPVSFVSQFIVTSLYGLSYAPAGTILTIYVWAQFGSNLGVARSTYLTIESKLHYSVYFSVSGAFLNILLNYFLIPHFQAIGATVATLITYFTVIVLSNFFVSDLKPVGLMILRSLNLYRAFLRILTLLK